MTTLETLNDWLADAPENEHLEFKEAKQQYDTTKLMRYCVALANEGGGHLVLGVSDKRFRQVVGTQAFQNQSLRERFRLPESKTATASQVIGATKDAGLIKTDESDTTSTRYARYLPFWA